MNLLDVLIRKRLRRIFQFKIPGKLKKDLYPYHTRIPAGYVARNPAGFSRGLFLAFIADLSVSTEIIDRLLMLLRGCSDKNNVRAVDKERNNHGEGRLRYVAIYFSCSRRWSTC